MALNKIVNTFKNDSFMFSISVIALALVIFHKSTSNHEAALSSKESQKYVDPRESVNTALKDVHYKGAEQRQIVEADNTLPMEDLHDAQLRPLEEVKSGLGPEGIEIEQRDKALEVAEDLQIDDKMVDYTNRLDAQVRRQLSNRDFLNTYSQDYEKEYIRQFLENARKDGYKVKLNEDLTVRSVERIRKRPLSKKFY